MGEEGEAIVRDILDKLGVRYVSNLYVGESREVSQIDFVVCESFGVVVIEVKNIRGEIKGDIEDKYWNVAYGPTRKQFFNPVLQNTKHISRLKKELNVNTKMTNLVIFSREGNLIQQHKDVIYFDDLYYYFKSMSEVLDDEYVNRLNERLQGIKEENRSLAEVHFENNKYLWRLNM